LKRIDLNQAWGQGILYGITDAHLFGGSCAEAAKALVLAGVSWVQYRAKGLDLATQRAELKDLIPWVRAQGAYLLVNDSVELAQELGADGVHLGQGDMEPQKARALLGPYAILGWSTHNLAQVQSAQGMDLDYLGVGPAFPTQTKPAEPVVGLDFLGQASLYSSLPLVAIGGIDLSRIKAVQKTGVRSVAMIQGLFEAPDLRARVQRIKERLAR